MATPGSSSSSRVERNMKERNRRMNMKDLMGRLASLLPQPSKLSASQILSDATGYIKQLQRNHEEYLKRKKQLLKGDQTTSDHHDLTTVINITNSGSILELNLVTGLNSNFMLYEIISALQEEGAEVIAASRQNVGGRTFYAIKSKVISESGVDTSRVEERLKELIFFQ